jgi:hypothetical protein
MDELPEFRVTLTRLNDGETAYPQGAEIPHYEYQGQRSKFGGTPDHIQGESPNPECPQCSQRMTFVAQIDSVEHDWPSNPHAVDALSDDRKWMFCDVGMIYVFYCFDCLHPLATSEFY